jgi:hypothetical protein
MDFVTCARNYTSNKTGFLNSIKNWSLNGAKATSVNRLIPFGYHKLVCYENITRSAADEKG